MDRGPIYFGTGLTTLKSSMSLILRWGEGQPTKTETEKVERKEQQFVTTQLILGSLYRHRSL